MSVYTLADIDLTGDGHGRHIPGTPIVFHHGWEPVNGVKATFVPKGSKIETDVKRDVTDVKRDVTKAHSKAKRAAQKVGLADKPDSLIDKDVKPMKPSELRAFRRASDEARALMVHESGAKLNPKYHGIDKPELHEMWKAAPAG